MILIFFPQRNKRVVCLCVHHRERNSLMCWHLKQLLPFYERNPNDNLEIKLVI
uniref:Uncharacterized protein n=1 Tax=Anguilla anguilla TaxID=7936 RepID=A0A0E9V733_ANGAN